MHQEHFIASRRSQTHGEAKHRSPCPALWCALLRGEVRACQCQWAACQRVYCITAKANTGAHVQLSGVICSGARCGYEVRGRTRCDASRAFHCITAKPKRPGREAGASVPVRCGIRSGVSASEEVRVSVPVRSIASRRSQTRHGSGSEMRYQEHFIASRRSQTQEPMSSSLV